MRIEHILIQLLSILASRSTVFYEELADQLQVSTRTVQRYLQELEEIFKQLDLALQIEYLAGQAIRLHGDYDKLALAMQRLKRLSINEERDRMAYIISLLINNKQAVTIQAIADKLFVGRSTVEKSLMEAQEFLKAFEVEIIGTNKGLVLEADERVKRKILSELIRGYWHGVVVNPQSLQNNLPLDIALNFQSTSMFEEDLIRKIQVLVNQFIYEHRFSVTEYQYQSLIIHIAIAIDRIEKGQFLTLTEQEVKLNEWTPQIIALIEEEFDLIIPSIEKGYLNLHIEGMVCGPAYTFDSIRIEDLEYGELIQEVLNTHLSPLYPDDILLKNIAIHLNTTLKRLSQKISIKNPYKETIKNDYTTAFNLAVEIALDLSNQTDLIFNVDEVTYIAIHIQSFFERKQTEKLEVVLVCASGVGTVRLLEQRLLQHFGDEINISEVVGLNQLNDLAASSKLIISTIPINSSSDNIVLVSPLLTDRDIQCLSKKIHRHRSGKEGAFRQLLSPEFLFYSTGQNENSRTVIEFITSQLIFRGVGQVGLLESALEREELSSTAMGTFSMPHGDPQLIDRSVICIYVNPNGIEWGDQSVKVVFFFAINPQKTPSITQVYKEFNDLISNEALIATCLALKSQKELKDYFLGKGEKFE